MSAVTRHLSPAGRGLQRLRIWGCERYGKTTKLMRCTFGFLHASGLHNPSLHRGALVVETSSPCFRDYLNEPSK